MGVDEKYVSMKEIVLIWSKVEKHWSFVNDE